MSPFNLIMDVMKEERPHAFYCRGNQRSKLDLGLTVERKHRDNSLCSAFGWLTLCCGILTPLPNHSATSCVSANTDRPPLDSSVRCQMPAFQDDAEYEPKPCCPVHGGHSVSTGCGPRVRDVEAQELKPMPTRTHPHGSLTPTACSSCRRRPQGIIRYQLHQGIFAPGWRGWGL